TPTAMPTIPSSKTTKTVASKTMPGKNIMKRNDETTLVSHLNNPDHVKYPITGELLIQNCNNMSDVNETDRKMFTEKIQKAGKTKTYASAQEVLNTVNK